MWNSAKVRRRSIRRRKGRSPSSTDFDLKMKKGEFISLIGHSGCGKSTVLSMTAGLNEITGGGIVLDGSDVSTGRAGPGGGLPGADR